MHSLFLRPLAGQQPPADGALVDAQGLAALRRHTVGAALEAARHEDHPRLRRARLSQHRRGRTDEADRRAVEQIYPEPPQLASVGVGRSASFDPAASGEATSPSLDDSAVADASGCVCRAAAARDDSARARTESETDAERSERQQESEAERLAAERDLEAAAHELERAEWDPVRRRLTGTEGVRNLAAQRHARHAMIDATARLVRAAAATRPQPPLEPVDPKAPDNDSPIHSGRVRRPSAFPSVTSEYVE